MELAPYASLLWFSITLSEKDFNNFYSMVTRPVRREKSHVTKNCRKMTLTNKSISNYKEADRICQVSITIRL
jgi:hypothetical protein